MRKETLGEQAGDAGVGRGAGAGGPERLLNLRERYETQEAGGRLEMMRCPERVTAHRMAVKEWLMSGV